MGNLEDHLSGKDEKFSTSMATRLPQQCLRTAVKLSFTTHRRTCLRTYVSAASPEPLPTPPSSSQSSEVKTPSKPTESANNIHAAQGASAQGRGASNIEVLPFDPPPRPARKTPSMEMPVLQTEVDDLLEYPPGSQGPLPLRIRKPFPVNQSWDVLHRFYTGLFGFEDYIERGYITKELAWQSVTYKSYSHGVDPYNEKLAHLGRSPKHLIHSFLAIADFRETSHQDGHCDTCPGSTFGIRGLSPNKQPERKRIVKIPRRKYHGLPFNRRHGSTVRCSRNNEMETCICTFLLFTKQTDFRMTI